MSAPLSVKIGRPRKASRKEVRGGRGGLNAFVSIAGGLVLAYLITPQWMTDPASISQMLGHGGPSLAEMRSGSIFIASMNQDTCRQRTFDNMTGLQWDLGVVDCRDAILQSRQGPSIQRMSAITDAFRSK